MKKEEMYAVSFSGGKDSILALDRSIKAGRNVRYLCALYDQQSARIRYHGVPLALLEAQAKALNLTLLSYGTTRENFEMVFLEMLADLKRRGVTGIIFGDIHLADVRAWYEERTRAAGFQHIEPIWQESSAQLVRECIARGYGALVTSREERTTRESWLGVPLSATLIQDFEEAGIDPSGEKGEYHTFVYSCPLFTHEIPLTLGEISYEAGYQMVDLIPE